MPRAVPKMERVSEPMKRLAAMLEDEVRTWPKISDRPMFGMTGLYRDNTIFAALPRTRTLGSPNSIIFRFDTMPPALLRRAATDPRIRSNQPGARWYSFELDSEEDLTVAIWWLSHAYEHASSKTRASRRR